MTDAIRAAIEGAGAYLTEHPGRGALHRFGGDSRASSRGFTWSWRARPNGERLETDMPPAVGGAGSAPSPGWFLRAARGGLCRLAGNDAGGAARHGAASAARSRSTPSRTIEASLASTRRCQAGPLSMRVGLRMSAQGIGLDELEELAVWAVDHCPVADAVRRAIPVHVEVSGA